jgi:glucose-6-phosphate 1-dehydrogenase
MTRRMPGNDQASGERGCAADRRCEREVDTRRGQARMRDSLADYGGGVDASAYAKLSKQLRYVGGDYKDPNLYQQLRGALGDAHHPLTLSTPPAAATTSITQVSGQKSADSRLRPRDGVSLNSAAVS